MNSDFEKQKKSMSEAEESAADFVLPQNDVPAQEPTADQTEQIDEGNTCQTDQADVCGVCQEMGESAVGSSDILVPPDEANAKRHQVTDKMLTIVLCVLIVVLIGSMILKCFVVCRIIVSGDSMMPNYQSGQTVWVNKIRNIQRGDVVVLYKQDVKNKFIAEFSFGEENQPGGKYEKLIKRVVALGGDKLWIEKQNDDYVLVIQTPDGISYEPTYMVNGEEAKFFDNNGTLCDIPYLGLLYKLEATSAEHPFVVMDGYFFVMGDNRHNSNDSRQLGAFPLTRLYGVVMN